METNLQTLNDEQCNNVFDIDKTERSEVRNFKMNIHNHLRIWKIVVIIHNLDTG